MKRKFEVLDYDFGEGNKSTPPTESIDTFVRDVTKIGSISKSEVRRRLIALLQQKDKFYSEVADQFIFEMGQQKEKALQEERERLIEIIKTKYWPISAEQLIDHGACSIHNRDIDDLLASLTKEA